MTLRLSAAVLTLGLAAVPAAALALPAPLPNAVAFGDSSVTLSNDLAPPTTNTGIVSAPGSQVTGLTNTRGSFNAIATDIAVGGTPRVGLNQTIIAGPGETLATGTAHASLQYSFMISGADAGPVLMSIHELGDISHSAFGAFESANAGGNLQISDSQGVLVSSAHVFLQTGHPGDTETFAFEQVDNGFSFAGDPNNPLEPLSTGFDYTAFATLQANTLYFVGLDVFLTDTLSPFDSFSGQASLMSVNIDPSFSFANATDAQKYQFVLSDGVGGGPAQIGLDAVPEPGVWAMLVAGFGLVGVTLRRRAASGRAIAALAH